MGGLQHVQAARAFMRSLLYRRRDVASNLLRLRERTEPQKILVAIHLQPGDFGSSSAAGVSPPLDWLCRMAQALRAALADEVQFLLVSERAFALPERPCGDLPCIRTTDLPPSECSDVLALAQADLLIGSASGHAALAAFLSDSPCLWFAPEPSVRKQDDQVHLRAGSIGARNTTLGPDDAVPPALIETLRQRRSYRRRESDLVRGGVIVPALAARSRG